MFLFDDKKDASVKRCFAEVMFTESDSQAVMSIKNR